MSKAGTVQGKWGFPFELLLLAHHSFLTDLAFWTLVLVFRASPGYARQLKKKNCFLTDLYDDHNRYIVTFLMN